MPLSISTTRLFHFPLKTTTATHKFFPLKPQTTTLLGKPNLSLSLFLNRTQIQIQTHILSTPTDQNPVEESNTPAQISDTRVLVQNVPWTCVAEDLRPLFQKYGTVVDIDLAMYNKSKNRGLAFVTMSTHEEARALLENLEKAEFQGRVLNTNWAYEKPKKAVKEVENKQKFLAVHNLFVSNLPFQARASDVKEFFNEGNANVVSAEVIFDSNRRSVGYGFVSFNTKAEADAALKEFDGKEFMGRALRVARSKRFLRKETKATIEGASESKTSVVAATT